MNGWLIALIVIVGIAFLLCMCYALLDGDHKHFVRSLLRQVPDLPGRYKI
jgi:hypothetical protein